jgi:hypothetical protein
LSSQCFFSSIEPLSSELQFGMGMVEWFQSCLTSP